MSKSITYGLLAVAVSSSLLVAQGEPAGSWSAKAGSGITYDGGDRFGINMLNFVQARWAFGNNENAPDSNNFDVPRARTLLRGHAFNKNINYVLQVDYMDDTSVSIVRDAYVHWNFADGVGLRLGQGKTQWGLENTGTIRGTMFTERSLASDRFNWDRTRGVWVMGTNLDNKLRWSAGLVNGRANEENDNDDNELGFVASANLDLMGDYFGGAREWWSQGDLRDGDRNLMGTIGVGLAMDNTKKVAAPPVIGADVETDAINVNTAWSVQGFQVIGEYYTSSEQEDAANGKDVTIDGYYVQGTYALNKSGDSALRWALGLRTSFVDNSEAAANAAETTAVSVVLDALYQGHNCKTQFELTKRDNDPTAPNSKDTTDYILGVAFQLVF